MSKVVSSIHKSKVQAAGLPKVGPAMSGESRLKRILFDGTEDSLLVKDVCLGLTNNQIIRCLTKYVYHAGRNSAYESIGRLTAESVLLQNQELISLEDLFLFCNTYRLRGLRREMTAFVENAFQANKINITGANDILKLMKELGLNSVTEHDLFDQLIAIERLKILHKTDEEKVEFLRAIGLCHSNHINDFKIVFEELLPRLPQLSPRNMTRLLMGWSQIKYINDEALYYALEHVGDCNNGYSIKERAIALKCLCTIASPQDVLKLWNNIEQLFTKQKINNSKVSNDLLRAISAIGLPMDQERMELLKRNVSHRPTEWIENDVFDRVKQITSSIGYSHKIRLRVHTEMAEIAFDYNDKSYAIVIDYPCTHRLGGYDDAPLCGSERIRNMILRRAEFIVLRIPEEILFQNGIQKQLEDFIQSDPKPDTYVMTIVR